MHIRIAFRKQFSDSLMQMHTVKRSRSARTITLSDSLPIGRLSEHSLDRAHTAKALKRIRSDPAMLAAQFDAVESEGEQKLVWAIEQLGYSAMHSLVRMCCSLMRSA